jgi:hypothetical protein
MVEVTDAMVEAAANEIMMLHGAGKTVSEQARQILEAALASPAEVVETPPPQPHLMGSLREALARMENCCEYLASTRSHEIYVAMIDGGQAQALLDLDAARRNAREVIAATEEAV